MTGWGFRMKASWFCISNKTDSTLEIDIFDEIGAWGITAKDFVSALRKSAVAAKQITININTPGGDCNEGFTMFDALQAVRATGVTVTANITGMAASMGSVIMLASDKITIAENGRIMIHRVSAGGYGNADDLAAVSEVAKQFEDRIVGLYVARTGKDEDTVRAWMKTPVGTWFFGDEAVEAGFADEVKTGAKAQAFLPKWASKFAMLPAALFDTGEIIDPAHTPQSPDTFMNKILAALATALGLKVEAGATEDQIAAAFAAYTPGSPTAELNLEDAETKSRFNAAVTSAITAQIHPLQEKLGTVETQLTEARAEITRLTNLQASGALGSAQGGAPVPGAGGSAAKKELTRAEFDQLKPVAKAEFIRNGGKLTD